jgi:hypothetical protein
LAGGRHIQAGDMVVYDNAPKSRSPAPPPIADFVVLIEQGRNRNCLHGKQLYDLPAKIDTVLRATQGINSTKYALITFGAGKPFNTHTMDGAIWSGRRGIQNALAKYTAINGTRAAWLIIFTLQSENDTDRGGRRQPRPIPSSARDRVQTPLPAWSF